jgi:hypothetical protein
MSYRKTLPDQLRIPGEFFFDSNETAACDPANLPQQLTQQMRQLRPASTNHHDNRKVFVQPALSGCSHVFLGDDSGENPYSSPTVDPIK